MEMNIVINVDNKYLQHAMATLCSLYENNKEHKIILHVMQSGLSAKSRNYINDLAARYYNKVMYYDMDDSRLEGVQYRKNRPLSPAAYYRLLLAEVLPKDLDKVLYLDCDMIILRDISEIFHLELDGFALAATLDQFPYSSQHRLQLQMEADERTFCSGIMLVNLKYWRDHNVTEGLLEYAKRPRKEIWLHDQDVLNYYFKKQWFLLPPKWNKTHISNRSIRYFGYRAFDYKEYVLSPMLIHFASVGIKPWYNSPCPKKSEYLKYLYKSNFKEITFENISNKKSILLAKTTLVNWLKSFLIKTLRKY